MSGWQMVTFYTSGTGYRDEVKRLVASAAKLDVPLHVYEYVPGRSWRENLNYKSACIMRAFEEFPDKDIAFVDADAVIRKWPELFDTLSEKHEYDLSACFYSYTPRSGDKDELLSGTLWIQNGETGRALVKRWHEVGLRLPQVRHQMCLKLALGELLQEGANVRVFRHPFVYTCIFDYQRARNGMEPVIEHFQASRRLRREVGFGGPLLTHPDPKLSHQGAAAKIGVKRRIPHHRISQGNNINVIRRHVGGGSRGGR